MAPTNRKFYTRKYNRHKLRAQQDRNPYFQRPKRQLRPYRASTYLGHRTLQLFRIFERLTWTSHHTLSLRGSCFTSDRPLRSFLPEPVSKMEPLITFKAGQCDFDVSTMRDMPISSKCLRREIYNITFLSMGILTTISDQQLPT